jgi:hypothetical protein
MADPVMVMHGADLTVVMRAGVGGGREGSEGGGRDGDGEKGLHERLLGDSS